MNKITIPILAVASLSMSAVAQRGFDMFGTPRTVVLGAPYNFTASTGLLKTNGPIDVRIFDGIANITLFGTTNSATTGGTLTATLYGSTDQTNLTAITYALATATSVSYTNYWYGTNGLTATDVFLLPGTVVTPTAATAGWATPYFNQAPFTNTAAISLTPAAPVEVGVNIGDAPRYLYVVWTAAGTVTNFTSAALLRAATHSGQLY